MSKKFPTPPKKVTNVVAGLVLDALGRGLIAQRSMTMSSPGLWEIPGGKVEKGESNRVALVRELQEELSVVVTVGNKFATVHADIHQKSFQMDAYVCRLVQGAIQPMEHSSVRWITADDIFTLTWAPLDIPLLPQLSQVLRKSFQIRQ